ncbi:MAG TPA: thioredoxin domain-containing protein [Polyangiaceae bacterium]|nr:thioredoxin domain-containing protein [Polyangiaceae bacterium]
MLSFRAASALALFAFLNTKLTTCRSPGESAADASPTRTETKDVTLAGVDTSSLTSREKAEWSRFVSELRSPCADQPVSVAQCVSESRACRACVPAAKALAKQVQRGRTRPQVEAFYKARFAADQIKNIELEDSPSKGNPGAGVVMVEFADFQCPACRAARPLAEEALKKHDGQVRLVFKNFPLSIHQYGEKLARSARAAQQQGKFWEMYAALFDNQDRISPQVVDELAKGLGLDMAKFAKDLESESVADSVSRDRKQGERLDIQSTPTFFINGRLFPSTPDFAEDLEDWLTLEIELTGGAPAPAAAPKPSAATSVAVPAPSAAAAPAPSGSATKKP